MDGGKPEPGDILGYLELMVKFGNIYRMKRIALRDIIAPEPNQCESGAADSVKSGYEYSLTRAEIIKLKEKYKAKQGNKDDGIVSCHGPQVYKYGRHNQENQFIVIIELEEQINRHEHHKNEYSFACGLAAVFHLDAKENKSYG